MQEVEHLLKCPRPDMLKGATKNIIELLGNGKTLWKCEIFALAQYEGTAVKSGLYRLYHYGLVQRDDFNLYSLSELGCKYFELMFEREVANVGVENPTIATTTTTNFSVENKTGPAQESQIHARSIPDSQSSVLETDSKQLETARNSSKQLGTDSNGIKAYSNQIHSFSDFNSVLVAKPTLGQNPSQITLGRSAEGPPRVVETGSGSSSPIARSKRTFFEPLNGGERIFVPGGNQGLAY